MSAPTDATVVDRDDLLSVLSAVPAGQVTLTGTAGSGYSLVAAGLGESVYRGALPLAWDTDVLVVMRQHLSAAAVDVLEQLGTTDPAAAVHGPRIGDTLLIRRA